MNTPATPFKHYRPSRKIMLFYLFVSAIFIAIGIFVALLPSIMANSNVRFSGDVRLLWWVGAGLVVAGTLLGSLAYWLVGAKPSVRLYDEAISVGTGKQWRTDRFIDIEDLYFFPSMGKIAYRTSAASSSKCNSQLIEFRLFVASNCRCSVSTSTGNFQPSV